MQKLPDLVPALSHQLKPLMRDSAQLTCMLFHPRIDRGITLDRAVESQQLGSHLRSRFSNSTVGHSSNGRNHRSAYTAHPMFFPIPIPIALPECTGLG